MGLEWRKQKGLFLGDPVAKIPSSPCRRPRFDPWSGNQIPHATTKILHVAIERSYMPKWRPSACLLNSLSHVQLFVTPGTAVCQAPLSMGFFRQEYWNGLPFPSPGLTQGSNPRLWRLLQRQTNSSPLVLPGKPRLSTAKRGKRWSIRVTCQVTQRNCFASSPGVLAPESLLTPLI